MPDGTPPDDAGAALPPRDLSFVAPLLPVIGRLVRTYFRADVRGLERVPPGPVLFVGNHSGGAGSPDSAVFIVAYLERFGADRPLYWLGHEALLQVPVLGDLLHSMGVLTADPEEARRVLRAGASVVVYPGGEIELHRPWTERNRIKFLGRTGFLRLARDTGVPLVPVVGHGAHNTYLPLTDGQAIARAIGLDRRFNIKTFPVSLALPWGLNLGDFLGHLPLPARIAIRVLDPIDVAGEFGDDLRAAYDAVTGRMQATLDDLARTGGDEAS